MKETKIAVLMFHYPLAFVTDGYDATCTACGKSFYRSSSAASLHVENKHGAVWSIGPDSYVSDICDLTYHVKTTRLRKWSRAL